MTVQSYLVVFIRFLVLALWLVILGRVLMSWLDPTFSRPVSRFLYSTTEPLLAPIRRFLPPTGMLDLSPLVLLLGLGVLLRLVL
jgi:YggT family protein